MDSTVNAARQIAVALDTDDWDEFEQWCALFGPRVGYLKVGLEAYVRWGSRAVEVARQSGGQVFLDLKLHDIPNTVAGAVASARTLGVALLTVHIGGGEAQLRAAAEAAGDQLGILGVTVLTSLDEQALAALEMPGTAAERVLAWARLGVDAGCRGIVTSAREVRALRETLPGEAMLVTPGIRPSGSDSMDQKRVATPATALADGADVLVIGRPLTRAHDPLAALAAITGEMAGVS